MSTVNDGQPRTITIGDLHRKLKDQGWSEIETLRRNVHRLLDMLGIRKELTDAKGRVQIPAELEDIVTGMLHLLGDKRLDRFLREGTIYPDAVGLKDADDAQFVLTLANLVQGVEIPDGDAESAEVLAEITSQKRTVVAVMDLMKILPDVLPHLPAAELAEELEGIRDHWLQRLKKIDP